jgi:hypothetical protein
VGTQWQWESQREILSNQLAMFITITGGFHFQLTAKDSHFVKRYIIHGQSGRKIRNS